MRERFEFNGCRGQTLGSDGQDANLGGTAESFGPLHNIMHGIGWLFLRKTVNEALNQLIR